MNPAKLIIVFLLTILSTNVLAYGSSSSKKACNKPKFTQFTPAHLSVVEPQSEFTFRASSLTNPETIEVSVKKQAIEIIVKESNAGYSITGKLPPSLQKTYARIDVKAIGTNNCKANDGWLLKIEAKP